MNKTGLIYGGLAIIAATIVPQISFAGMYANEGPGIDDRDRRGLTHLERIDNSLLLLYRDTLNDNKNGMAVELKNRFIAEKDSLESFFLHKYGTTDIDSLYVAIHGMSKEELIEARTKKGFDFPALMPLLFGAVVLAGYYFLVLGDNTPKKPKKVNK